MARLRKILICVLICTVALCMGAFAAETADPDANGAYTVQYQGTQGSYYAILVVEGTYAENEAPSITADSILYISQETADAQGNAVFAEFKLKENVEGTIYIGGSDLEKAVLYGYTTPVSEGFDVTGTVAVDSGSAVEANVTFTSIADETKIYTAETVSGVYTLTVPADTYKFVVTKKAHLSYTDGEYAVTANATKDVTLKGGDVNDTGEIDHADVLATVTNYRVTEENVMGDVNGDGTVDHADLLIVVTNYKLSATQE